MAHAQLEIIAAAFEAATREMAASLVRTAFSPNIKERADCSTALCDASGRALSLMTNAPAHLGSTLRLVPAILQRFPVETLAAGDAFLANDPYIVGVTHLNDCTVATPVFHAGRLVAFAVAVAHHSDVGGRVPGSESGDNTSIYQEGIRVPPVRIYARGERCADVVEMFLLNSRMPHYGEGDLMAQMASCARGTARVHELFDRYGAQPMLRRIDELLDATERRVRARIGSELVEGTYHAVDWLDEDGITGARVKLAVALTVRSGHLTLDLSGCSPQVGSGKNVPLTHCYATAYFCLKSIVDPFVPTNEGLYRTVSIVAPEGLVVNPVAPAAVSSRNMTSMILAEALTNALGQAAPARSVAAGGPGQGCISAGVDPKTKRFFINYENLAGGQGARCRADGMDVVMINMTNTSNLPVEAMEVEFPVRIERYELVTDSGGPGMYRGGMGVLRDMRILADQASASLRSARQKFPAPGLAGGLPGGLGAFIRNPGGADETRLAHTTSGTPLANGDLLRIITPGGGGYGAPQQRAREAVARDLRQGKISLQAAQSIYGHAPSDDAR
jgi:N-methylhydantoinase B